ncbi:MAG TPA: hypothetical protein PLP23_10510 [Panacibacter sp.]|nr:hypothetical protein [Panacibacter sp.]
MVLQENTKPGLNALAGMSVVHAFIKAKFCSRIFLSLAADFYGIVPCVAIHSSAYQNAA